MSTMPATHPPLLPTVLAVLAAAACPPTAAAQQILEVDLSAGRTIIDDQWRSMGSIILAVDHDRGILYVNDAEEPEGIMAFSLSTGERIRVLPAREGDGPHEFSQGHSGMTMGPGGRLYVSGLLRVIEFDSTGVPVSSWTPRAPTSKLVCNLGGQPAIPAQYGVIRRGPGGADEGIGPNVVNSHVLMARDREESSAISDRIWSARIACTDDAAYVAMNYPEGPDTVFVYDRNGEEGRLPVPTEFTEDLPECTQQIRRLGPSSGAVLRKSTPDLRPDRGQRPDRPCPTWNQRLYPSLDGDRGNIVLMGYHRAIAGAIVLQECLDGGAHPWFGWLALPPQLQLLGDGGPPVGQPQRAGHRRGRMVRPGNRLLRRAAEVDARSAPSGSPGSTRTAPWCSPGTPRGRPRGVWRGR